MVTIKVLTNVGNNDGEYVQFQPFDGYDMRRNLSLDWTAKGHYSTDLFTEESVRLVLNHDVATPLFLYLSHLAPHAGNARDPFQAPDDEVARFSHIQDPERRVYAGDYNIY